VALASSPRKSRGCGVDSRHDREDHEDPQKQRNVAEAFDIDRHQARHDPVLGQAQHTGEDAEDGGHDTAEERHEERVEDADKRGAAMGRVVGVFDQALVDVVAGPVFERKAKLKSLPSAARFWTVLFASQNSPDMIRMNATPGSSSTGTACRRSAGSGESLAWRVRQRRHVGCPLFVSDDPVPLRGCPFGRQRVDHLDVAICFMEEGARLCRAPSCIDLAERRRVEQAAIGPLRVQAARQTDRRVLTDVAFEDFAVVADGGDRLHGPVSGGRASRRGCPRCRADG
jgi:hypothetical protein